MCPFLRHFLAQPTIQLSPEPKLWQNQHLPVLIIITFESLLNYDFFRSITPYFSPGYTPWAPELKPMHHAFITLLYIKT